MKNSEVSDFFECLGEICRDTLAIEFLMRCAIAKFDKQVSNFPKPPYTKGRVYSEVPNSFVITYFSEVVKEFNRRFNNFIIPQELIDFRNAMAHGVIFKIDESKIDELVKFKSVGKNGDIKIDFSMSLELGKLKKFRREYSKLRIYLMKLASD